MRIRIRTLAVAVTLGLCWWCCLGGAPAQAHTALMSSAPERGAVFAKPPTTVRLTFTEDLGGGSLAVTAAGRSVAAGASRVDGTDLVLDVAPGAPAGTWTVAYRVVSADGHPVTGQFTFTVRAAATAPKPTPLDTPSTSPSSKVTATPTAAAPVNAKASGKAMQSPAVEIAVAALALIALVAGVFVRRRGRS